MFNRAHTRGCILTISFDLRNSNPADIRFDSQQDNERFAVMADSMASPSALQDSINLLNAALASGESRTTRHTQSILGSLSALAVSHSYVSAIVVLAMCSPRMHRFTPLHMDGAPDQNVITVLVDSTAD